MVVWPGVGGAGGDLVGGHVGMLMSLDRKQG